MIKIRSLYKRYKDFEALRDINLDIKDGELVLLKGVSGSGKSTLLHLIASLDKPSSGEILIDNKPISKMPQHHSSKLRVEMIGYTPQDFLLINSLSVYQNVSLPLIALNKTPKEIDKRVKEVLEISNIKNKIDANSNDLSGGEKQRVAIARSLACDPKILLFDEPTANLDKKNSLLFLSLLSELKKLDKTIIIATHDFIFEEFKSIDRIINIENGKIVSG